MKDPRFALDAKILTLDDGTELYYCELGEENEEVIISPAHYFLTWSPVLEGLAEKYHVFGVIMRFDGPVTQRNADNSVNWARQYGDDVYRFAKKMGFEQFHYLGKCHGTLPGWYLVKEHPEMLKSFSSFFLAPHLCPQNSNKFFGTMINEGVEASTRLSIRHQERVEKKLREVEALGGSFGNPDVSKYDASPELIWDSLEECEETLKTTEVPICLLFGTDDLLFQDHYDSNVKAMKTINRVRTIILQGERHLVEMDCPDRLVNECMIFIEESTKNYD
jgi:pimeloyl-ACP methyl ester carboxylesterase